MTRIEKYTHGFNLTTISLLAAFAYTATQPEIVPCKPTTSQKWQRIVGELAVATPAYQLQPIVTAKPSHKPIPPPAARHPVLRASL